MQATTNTKITVEGYPPKDHILRDLGISLRFQGKLRCTIEAPVLPQVCTERGAMMVGVIAMLVDVLGGALAVRAVYPDWIATSGISIHTTGRASSGVLTATGSVMRAGRTSVVIQVDIHEAEKVHGSKKSIGSAMMTFSRLPRREDTPEIPVNDESTETVEFTLGSSGPGQSLLEKSGIRILEGAQGVVEVDMADYVRNSFHALQGGMIAVLGDIAGERAARAATAGPLATSDLDIHYLSQGKSGPFRTTASVLRATHDTALTRIEVIDCGADNRLLAVVMNTSTTD